MTPAQAAFEAWATQFDAVPKWENIEGRDRILWSRVARAATDATAAINRRFAPAATAAGAESLPR